MDFDPDTALDADVVDGLRVLFPLEVFGEADREEVFAEPDPVALAWEEVFAEPDLVALAWEEVFVAPDPVALAWEEVFAEPDPVALAWEEVLAEPDSTALALGALLLVLAAICFPLRLRAF